MNAGPNSTFQEMSNKSSRFCCERRGSFWVYRDVSQAAALGSDSDPERTYFNDVLIENSYAYAAQLNYLDNPPTSTAFHNNAPANETDITTGTFINSYGVMSSYGGYAMLHDPLAANWLAAFVHEYVFKCSETVVGARGIAQPCERQHRWHC